MSVVDFPSDKTPEWLKKYYERGFRLVFYNTKQKGPSGPDATNWTARDDKADSWKLGSNVGVFTGTELSPGKYLADIDFDCADGLPLSKFILPPTEYGFGRETRKLSHAFYTTPEPIASLVFENIDGKPIVELRGTKQDGTIGQQTMMPPSIHPNGETLVLRLDGEIGHSEDLPRKVALYAVAYILFANFADRSFIHDVRLATAGFLLSEGLNEAEVMSVGKAICENTGNSSADFALVVKTTLQKIKNGDRVQGKTALIKALGDQGKEIISKIKGWLGSSQFIEDSRGRVIADNQENTRIALEKIGVTLSYDMFSQKGMIRYESETAGTYDGPQHDQTINQAWHEIDEKYHFRASKDYFHSVVDNISHKNRFHPVIDYLKTLTWDGVPRVDTWLIRSGGAVDSDYVKAVSSIMLIAAVRRVTAPGCKYDEMVVLESATQGLLKSTALRTLCPNDKWFSDDLPLNVDAKQIVERTLGKWIIEASDLSGMRAADVEHLKGMLSRQVDGPVRLAYARIPVEQPRQSIIVGTTNSYSYLTDSTGNRRFWPIRITGFDIDWLRENRDQIWAEAYVREQNGESIRLSPSLYAHASMQQERRRAEDPWEMKLAEVFTEDKKWRLSPDEVWLTLGIGIDKRDPRSNGRVLKAMESLGFRRVTVRTEEGKVVKGFARDPKGGQQELPE